MATNTDRIAAKGFQYSYDPVHALSINAHGCALQHTWPQLVFLSRAALSLAFDCSYVGSNFFSNFWRIFGKLWEARSLLYRSQSLQPNTHFAAFFEIYKIFILLHHSEFKNSAKFCQTFSQFCSFIFESSLIFRNFCPKFTNFHENFPEFPANCTNKIKYAQFSNFLMFRSEYCRNFHETIFEKLEKS